VKAAAGKEYAMERILFAIRKIRRRLRPLARLMGIQPRRAGRRAGRSAPDLPAGKTLSR
jgi:hypothetical protein